MSQIIPSGKAAATSSTKSHSPLGKRSMSSVTSRSARERTWSSIRATSLGANPRETMLRKRKCLGSSMLIMEPKNSFISIGRSPILEPLPLQKSCGLRLMCQMSSCRVMARYPGPVGKGEPSITSSLKKAKGDSSRRVLKAPSRKRRSLSQNSGDERSMSARLTLGRDSAVILLISSNRSRQEPQSPVRQFVS
ncbi:unannotated protein [freshwater metagenome]|uniref:Unannotated protein n=2 Tax=freshwater metagenome TaxID=449393 RepID=A0A6J6GXD6_9ZZZZ